MTRFVAIDVETDGLDPEVNQIIEVGLVFEQLGEVYERTFSLPFEPGPHTSLEAMEVNGWENRDHPEEWPERVAASYLARTLEGAHLVGRNPSLDAGFLKALLGGHGYAPTWHHRMVDVGCLAWGYNNKPTWSSLITRHTPPNASQAAAMLGVPDDSKQEHTALHDAQQAWACFRKVVPA